MSRFQSIVEEMQYYDHVADPNTPTRRFFRGWIDGSYLGESHYHNNCSFIRDNKDSNKHLRMFVIDQFCQYMAHEYEISRGQAQKAIVASMPKDKLAELTAELIENAKDLIAYEEQE